MGNTRYASLEELEAGLDRILQSPPDSGELKLIVRRPEFDKRETLDEAMLDTAAGLVGDTWLSRGSSRTPDGGTTPG